MWQRFDIVRLTTTKNIEFLSGPPGRPTDPQGDWSVVGNIPGTGHVLLAKDSTIVLAPIIDIRKIASYDINRVIRNLKKVRSMSDLEEKKDAKEKE